MAAILEKKIIQLTSVNMWISNQKPFETMNKNKHIMETEVLGSTN